MKSKKVMLSIIVPVFNEEKTVRDVIQNVLDLKVKEKQVIVVDDGSTDSTRNILKSFSDISLIFYGENRGKGYAIRQGLKIAKGKFVAIQDADLEYDCRFLVSLLTCAQRNKLKVVYGSRIIGRMTGHYYAWHYWGNILLSAITSLLYSVKISDMETGQKLFKLSVIKQIELTENGFGFEPEVTSKMLKKGFKIKEIGVTFNARTFEEGKKINWRDGIKAVFILIINMF